MNGLKTILEHHWRADRLLTATGLFLLAALAAFSLGVVLDSRVVTGAPVWLKPAKFAASTAIYSFTLAWVFRFLGDWPRTRRVVGRLTAAIFVIEVGIIALQAARGTASHFNTATLLDSVLFSVMGAGIVTQTIASGFVAVALWRQRFADRAVGWALRLGMTLTIVGALTGGLMTRPTSDQIAAARVTQQMPVSGAHTVGVPDGGPGLPGVGWSTRHGDLRVAHFVGLHALQLLAAVLLLLPVAWSARRRVRTILMASASHAALFAILLWQALRGEPLVTPGAPTLLVLAAWAATTVAGLLGTSLIASPVRQRRSAAAQVF